MTQLHHISMKEIREDFFFCFHTELDDSLLCESIQRSGIRLPLILEERNDGFRILSGFRRWMAAKTLQFESVPAEIIKSSHLPVSFIKVIHEQRVQGKFNLVEKARILFIASQLNIDIDPMLTSLDLAEQSKQVPAITHLLSYPEPVLAYIEQYDVSLKKSRMFGGITDPTLKSIVHLAADLQIRSVELAQILKGMKEIARRNSESVESIYEQMIQSISGREELNRNQKMEILKDWIQVQRYPRLSEWNEKIQSTYTALQLPAFAKMSWDQSLENPGVRLNVSLHSEEDVEKLGVSLSDPKKRSLWKKLFDFL